MSIVCDEIAVAKPRAASRSALTAAVLGAFCLWACVPAVIAFTGHGVFNGTLGIDTPDLMQYLGFVRDSGQHVLISNVFDVTPDPHLFLDPVFALSGLLWRLGASIQLAWLVWVPVAGASLIWGFTRYVGRLLGGDGHAPAAALALALLYLAPATALAVWLHGSPALQFGTQVVGLEMFAGAYAWGGGPAIALALMPVVLLAVERLLDAERRDAGHSARWYAGWASLGGLLTSWLHPWQGLTLLAIFAGLVLWGRLERRYLALAIPAALTAAPLVYFLVLSRTHSSWMTVSRANDYSHFGWWLAAGLAPAAVALFGFAGRRLDLQERMLRIWPVAALVVYFALDRTWFYHAFAGLSLPLGVLAVRGVRKLRVPRPLAVAGLLAAILPGLVWVMQRLIDTNPQHFFAPGEARALAFMDRSARPGPVLAPAMPLGQAVPGFTGRQTYVGHYYWTPDYQLRVALVGALFGGRLAPAPAAALVRASRAAFLLADCRHDQVDLRRELGSLVRRAQRFGCATVYELAPSLLQAQTVPPSGVRFTSAVAYPAR
jgi:hypothetical protein